MRVFRKNLEYLSLIPSSVKKEASKNVHYHDLNMRDRCREFQSQPSRVPVPYWILNRNVRHLGVLGELEINQHIHQCVNQHLNKLKKHSLEITQSDQQNENAVCFFILLIKHLQNTSLFKMFFFNSVINSTI
jgi:hypothetical protein